MQIEPDNASVLIALVNTGVYMGNAIGAAIGALWLKAMPVTSLPYSAAATIAMALLVLIVSLRRRGARAGLDRLVPARPRLQPREPGADFRIGREVVFQHRRQFETASQHDIAKAERAGGILASCRAALRGSAGSA